MLCSVCYSRPLRYRGSLTASRCTHYVNPLESSKGLTILTLLKSGSINDTTTAAGTRVQGAARVGEGLEGGEGMDGGEVGNGEGVLADTG